MNQLVLSYEIANTPGTAVASLGVNYTGIMTGLFLTGAVAATIASSAIQANPILPSELMLIGDHTYYGYSSNSTYGTLQNMFSGRYERRPSDFDAELINAFQSLSVRQEALGKEFEAVLYRNLLALYDSD